MGAQVTIISPAMALSLGVRMNEMVPIRVTIVLANGKQTEAIGGIPIIMGSNYHVMARSY